MHDITQISFVNLLKQEREWENLHDKSLKCRIPAVSGADLLYLNVPQIIYFHHSHSVDTPSWGFFITSKFLSINQSFDFPPIEKRETKKQQMSTNNSTNMTIEKIDQLMKSHSRSKYGRNLYLPYLYFNIEIVYLSLLKLLIFYVVL